MKKHEFRNHLRLYQLQKIEEVKLGRKKRPKFAEQLCAGLPVVYSIYQNKEWVQKLKGQLNVNYFW